MVCSYCAAELHGECYDLGEDSDLSNYYRTGDFRTIPCCCHSGPQAINTAGQEQQRRNAAKEDSAVTDPESTGRKRAAVLYPITPGMACEWRGLKNACGGKVPIIGCIEGTATHRHHGPDKNTLNNEPGNVHRICHTCHNRWHALNDPLYGAVKTLEEFIPHDPDTIATPEEQLANELEWAKRPQYRTKDAS